MDREPVFSVVLADITHAFAIHRAAVRADFVPGNIVIFAVINELKSSFSAIIIISLFSIYTKTTIHLGVGGQWWIFTSPLRVNSC